jgi:hypothetical protein
MKTEILDLIAINRYQNFIFEKCKSDDSAVAELKKRTQNVPNKDGVYFVFAHFAEDRNIENHLTYEINNNIYELIYFGKAGGLTSKGKEGEQKLIGRMNAVVGEDISRAIKWNQEMHKNHINSLTVYYCLLEQPQIFEEKIYTYLKNEKLKYPMLNKKRGRPAKKQFSYNSNFDV